MTSGDTWTRTTRTIPAPAEALSAAFLDPDALLAWLPPAGMTGRLDWFDARVGGGYRMALTYPPNETTYQGKTTEHEDLVNVRIVALDPPHRIVEAITFVTDDPAFQGEMTLTITFEESGGNTEVTLFFENLPPGLRPEDNDIGAQISLEQLARYAERAA